MRLNKARVLNGEDSLRDILNYYIWGLKTKLFFDSGRYLTFTSYKRFIFLKHLLFNWHSLRNDTFWANSYQSVTSFIDITLSINDCFWKLHVKILSRTCVRNTMQFLHLLPFPKLSVLGFEFINYFIIFP